MRIVHCECGLGNQMCYYAQYLALKKKYPEDQIYLETFLFDVPGIEKYMKMWNGYELENVFGIKTNDVKDILKEKYDNVIGQILESKFWESSWAASQNIISQILYNNNLIKKENVRKVVCKQSKAKDFYAKHRNTLWGYVLRNIVWNINGKTNVNTYSLCETFTDSDQEFFFDLFDIIRPNSGIQSIRLELLDAFSFPDLKEEKNIDTAREIQRCNSVSIHVRKSDCYKYNADCFKFGYFKRSVNHIKSKVSNPHFYIFSDDPKWVLSNLKTIGLNENDVITFVNWNDGKQSYIDMQLMSLCKHNISTNSTFGFWASFLNKNPNKITCAPKGSFDVTNWF